MADMDNRIAELQQTAEAVAKLAENEALFNTAVEAFRAQNAEGFQAALAHVGLQPRCRLVCRFLCSRHCIFICLKLCKAPPEAVDQLPIAEWRAFSQAVGRIAKDEALLKQFVDAVDREDVKTFNDLVNKSKLQRFCHQLCHWLCAVRCRRICELLCPPPPLITEVGFIPTSQIDPTGRAAGPSFPPGPTPADDKPAGVGDHPFGGITNVRGVFNIASPIQYKVEWATAPAGPWTPILQSIADFKFNPAYPPPPLFIYYSRLPDALGWYNVSDMGLAGFDYLTDWQTPPDADKLYYLKLTVRNAALVEFESPVVPARVDNVAPTKPVIQLELQTPDGKRTKLGCCETVKRGDGNLIAITLTASDANFSQISVGLLGGCGVSIAIVDTGGTSLSKTYNGNIADTGYPVPTTFLWDPWAAKVNPCCYIIDVRIYDRVIAGNYWSGGHSNENWQSITIA